MSQLGLFGREGTDASREPRVALAEGAVVLRGFAHEGAETLLTEVARIVHGHPTLSEGGKRAGLEG